MDKASNNKFPGNPGIMHDGRMFTDYRPNVDLNFELNQRALGAHAHNDHLYRQYLTNNGKNLSDENHQRTIDKLQCRNIHSQQYSGLPGMSKCDDNASYLDFVARPKNLM